MEVENDFFVLSLTESTRLKANTVAIPQAEAADLLIWVQYQQALNDARDPSVLPAGAQRNFYIAEQIANREIFGEIIEMVLPYVSEAVPAGAERFLQNS